MAYKISKHPTPPSLLLLLQLLPPLPSFPPHHHHHPIPYSFYYFSSLLLLLPLPPSPPPWTIFNTDACSRNAPCSWTQDPTHRPEDWPSWPWSLSRPCCPGGCCKRPSAWPCRSNAWKERQQDRESSVYGGFVLIFVFGLFFSKAKGIL